MNKQLLAGLFLLVLPLCILLVGWLTGLSYGLAGALCAICWMICYPLILSGMAKRGEKPPQDEQK